MREQQQHIRKLLKLEQNFQRQDMFFKISMVIAVGIMILLIALEFY
jgi:hypothetical protein